ncbi:response regulator [Desertivirga xinjiangensis]|uniref:response regulator n=1 Tax=Desertivirga xinjiangensis TaxID=539206 RepID=UPI0021086FBC|nr:response regulator [Pedobacter xinjiangensis]
MSKYNFIVIDDSALDCFIAEKMIVHTGLCETVRCFTQASDALEYIQASSLEAATLPTVVILDVLMPMMSGFAFVEAFEDLPEDVKERYTIVALTSSMNKTDMEKIVSYQVVKKLLDKPITSETIITLLER